MIEIACHRCDRRGRGSLEPSLESKPSGEALDPAHVPTASVRRAFDVRPRLLATSCDGRYGPVKCPSARIQSSHGRRVRYGFYHRGGQSPVLDHSENVIASSSPSGTIEIFHDNKWVSSPYRLIQVEPEAVDIAVLALDQQLGAVLPVTLGMKGAFLSEAVFFVGFPYGSSIEGGVVNSGYPLPLVKHGIIAAFFNQEGRPFIIDGINNPGFSGGPVVIAPNPQNPNIIGVVSGYRASVEPVFQQGQKNPNLSVQTNTGLLIAFEIDYAVKAIQKNPIGYFLHK